MNMKTYSEKLVSVNITTYNRSHLLTRCLDSVLQQDYPNIEVVVVDDCSADDTQQVMKIYQEKDARVKYFRHPINKGNAYARNTALEHCHGYYVAFLDDDDEWIDEEKLSKQVQIFEEIQHPKLGIVCSGVKVVTKEGKELIKVAKKPKDLMSVLLKANGIIHNSTVLTRKAVMTEAGGFDTNLKRGIDSDFYRNCVVRLGYDVHFMSDITTTYYEDNPDRITLKKGASSNFQVARNQVYVIKKYWKYFLKYPRTLFYRIKQCLKAIVLYMSYTVRENLQNTKLYQLARALYRAIWWRSFYRRRTIREYLQRYKTFPKAKKNPIVFMTGMPRTGSSLMKNFFGTHPALKVMPFQRDGFFVSWEQSFQEEKILIDKSTHYIRHLEKIVATCKDQAYICCIVRDPRAQLCSLFEFEAHPETSRGKRFWKQWYNQYQQFLEQAAKYQNIKFFLLRYEDMVREPERAKTIFLEWLGVETSVVNNRYEIASSQDIQDPKVFKKRTVSTDSLARWKEIQDPKQKEVLMAYENMEPVRELMTSFGYLPELGKIQLEASPNVKVLEVDVIAENKLG